MSIKFLYNFKFVFKELELFVEKDINWVVILIEIMVKQYMVWKRKKDMIGTMEVWDLTQD